jgi:hypothetical protein
MGKSIRKYVFYVNLKQKWLKSIYLLFIKKTNFVLLKHIR